MGVIVENKLITLNTRYAEKINGTYNSNLLFNFRGILVPDDDIISSNICIMNAQLPVSWYIINETNAYITIDPASLPVMNIYLTFGNYNANTLITEILARIAALQPTFIPTITISQITGRLSFTFPESTTLVCPTTSVYGPNFSGRILGFDAGVSYTGITINAPYPCNLLGINRLAIRSNKLTISSYNSVTLNLGITLATIPVNVPAFSLVDYSNQTDLNKAELKINYIDAIDIIIVDEDNNFVNFNNIDWTMTLVLENIRRIPDKPTTSFNDLTTPIQLSEPPEIQNDIKELELLA
jgi:hypothetical protein